MKTKIVCLTMALFFGCANAELGSYRSANMQSTSAFLDSLKDRSDEEICSAGKTKKITLRSFDGKHCDNKEVCDMLQSRCLKAGKSEKEIKEIKESKCYKNCQKNNLLTTNVAPTRERSQSVATPKTGGLDKFDPASSKQITKTEVPVTDHNTNAEVKGQQHATNKIAPASPDGLKSLEKIKAMPTATLPELESKLAAIKETITNLGKPITPPTSDPNNALRQELGGQQRTTQAQIETLKNREKSTAPVAKPAVVKNETKAPAATDAHIATASTTKAPSLQEQLQGVKLKSAPPSQNRDNSKQATMLTLTKNMSNAINAKKMQLKNVNPEDSDDD